MVEWLLLMAIGASPVPSLEQDLSDLNRMAAAKSWREAAPLARQVERAFAMNAPLEVFEGHALLAPANGLGIFEPVPGGVVRGEELFLYAQVRNHHLRKKGKAWELHLVSDLIVLDREGNELARDTAFGESRFSARARHRDTFVNIALRATGLPKGSYRIRLVVHDRIGGHSGSVEIPFSIP